jgi:gamma-glutamyltranspeptidase
MERDILSSVDEARLHHQLCPDEVLFENQFDQVFFVLFFFHFLICYTIIINSFEKNVLTKLSSKGHNLFNFGHGGSAVQAIERLKDGRLHAVCDVRKGGVPGGF